MNRILRSRPILSMLGLLFACTPPKLTVEGERPDVDRPWTETDQRALDELAETWDSQTPPSPTEIQKSAMPTAVAADVSTSLLEIYVFNIGQADAMLLIGPAPGRRTLLIDLGEPTRGSVRPPSLTSSAMHVYQRIQELTARTHVDYFLLSHYHSDHAGYGAGSQDGWGTGIIGLLSDFSVPFSVGEFIHVQRRGAEFMKDPNQRGVHKTIMRRMPLWIQRDRVSESGPPRFGTDQIDLGVGVTVEILAAAGAVPNGTSAFTRAEVADADYSDTPGNENDLSIALEISAGEFELFTAGDLNGTNNVQQDSLYVLRPWGEIYTNVERHMVSYWKEIGRENDVEIYRANHHGSGYSTTARLLDALDPEFILYSTGADHGHPSNTIVRRGATTARQFATTWVKDITTFQSSRGAIREERGLEKSRSLLRRVGQATRSTAS